MIIGLGLILIGMLFLLDNLGIMRGDFWNYIWPLVFILIGISIISKRTGKNAK